MFLFLKYIQPTWNYRLVSKSRALILSDFSKLNNEEKSTINYDNQYSNFNASTIDAAYQGLMTGIIPNRNSYLSSENIIEVTSVIDNYRFVKKYFGLHWYFYVYFLRMITLRNPIRETFCFFKQINTKRNILRVKRESESVLNSLPKLKTIGKVSVIIPTLNRYEYLKDVLCDLENQDYPNFEVLVCDQSEPVNESFYQGWRLDLTLIKQKEKALWLARNTCIKQSKGEYILLFDDDSRVEKDWITNHLKCLQKFNASISAGVTHTIVGHGLSPKETFFHLSDVFDTGNAMVKREVFEHVGYFDRQFEKQRMGDGEFGLRAMIAGYQLISNPTSGRIHLKVSTGGLRQMGSWDALRPKHLFAPRPIPSVLYLKRKYFGNTSTIYFLIQNIPFSLIPYKWKGSRLLKTIYLFALPFLSPLLFLACIKAWKEASRKLKIGFLP